MDESGKEAEKQIVAGDRDENLHREEDKNRNRWTGREDETQQHLLSTQV